MAEEEKKEEAKEAAPPAEAKGSKKKLFLIIGGILFLLVATGVPLTLFVLKKGGKEQVELPAEHGEGGHGLVAEGSNDEDELLENEQALGAIFPLDTFVVNLHGGRYVRCQVQLEFNGRDVPKRFFARLVPIRDGVITMLASRAAEDLLKPQGRDALKRDVRDLINEILRKEEVKNVYFTQLVVQ